MDNGIGSRQSGDLSLFQPFFGSEILTCWQTIMLPAFTQRFGGVCFLVVWCNEVVSLSEMASMGAWQWTTMRPVQGDHQATWDSSIPTAWCTWVSSAVGDGRGGGGNDMVVILMLKIILRMMMMMMPWFLQVEWKRLACIPMASTCGAWWAAFLSSPSLLTTTCLWWRMLPPARTSTHAGPDSC